MEMSGAIHLQLGRLLVIVGIALVVLGLVVMSGIKLPFSNFGRLPGDIALRGKHYQFYFPVVTCLVLSAVATAILWLISFLKSR